MMDLNRYKNDGWGLSKKQMTELLNLINDYKKSVVRIIEFGSGKSTEFLGDMAGGALRTGPFAGECGVWGHPACGPRVSPWVVRCERGGEHRLSAR